MDSVSLNPKMLILDADPERYIRTPSGAVVAIIKAAEGFAAFSLLVKMVALLKFLYPDGKILPIQVLLVLMPKEIQKLVMPAGVTDVADVFYPRLVLGGETAVKVLGWAAAAAVTVILACVLVEAVFAVLLWLLLVGSQVLAFTRRAIFYAMIVLALSFAGQLGLYIYCYSFDAKGDGAVHLLIVTLAAALVLALRVSYERGAATVLRAIAYEFKLGFKETMMTEVPFGRDTLLFAIIFLAAAGALTVLGDWKSMYVIALGVLAFKQIAVYSSWMDYQRCHM